MYSVKSGFRQFLDTALAISGLTTFAIVKFIIRTCAPLIQHTQLALDEDSSIRIDESWNDERVTAFTNRLIKEPRTAAAIRDVTVLCDPRVASDREASLLLQALLTHDFDHTLQITTLETTEDLLIQMLQCYDWLPGEPRFEDYRFNPRRHSPQAWEDALASKQFKVLQGLDALTINCYLKHSYTPDFVDHTLAGFCRAYKGTLTRFRLVKASHPCPRLLSSLADNLVTLQISMRGWNTRHDMPWPTETLCLHSGIVFPRLEKLELHEAAYEYTVPPDMVRMTRTPSGLGV